MSKDLAVPWLPGDALTQSSGRWDDPVAGFQSRHTPPDLQHFPDTFVSSHSWQRGECGIGPCREAGGELQPSDLPSLGAASNPSKTSRQEHQAGINMPKRCITLDHIDVSGIDGSRQHLDTDIRVPQFGHLEVL